ncbi:MAG: hypothetical protein MUF06_23785 [Pirellulaceae bacterium]|nr:hypothetical protein [Pirellulaceae bacterium]
MPRPKFTVRDILWLTLFAATAFGWFVDRGRIAKRLRTCELKCSWTACGVYLPAIEQYLSEEGFEVKWDGEAFTIHSPNTGRTFLIHGPEVD